MSKDAIVFAISAETDDASLAPNSVHFIQTEALTKAGIAVQKYGAIIVPASQNETEITIEAEVNGTVYKGATTITSASDVGVTVTMNKQ